MFKFIWKSIWESVRELPQECHWECVQKFFWMHSPEKNYFMIYTIFYQDPILTFLKICTEALRGNFPTVSSEFFMSSFEIFASFFLLNPSRGFYSLELLWRFPQKNPTNNHFFWELIWEFIQKIILKFVWEHLRNINLYFFWIYFRNFCGNAFRCILYNISKIPLGNSFNSIFKTFLRNFSKSCFANSQVFNFFQEFLRECFQ